MTVANQPLVAPMKPACIELDLQVAYEDACREVETICTIENQRRLGLQALLLEGENEELQGHLEQDEERIEQLEISLDNLQKDLAVAVEDSESAQMEARLRTREVETLRTELASMNGLSTDSNNILTEKLALTREITALKPELEHLRSLASSHQTLLGDKLALQRQVNTLQVEVENERRSTARIAQKEGRSQADEAKLEASLDAAHAELAKEQRERQKSEREHQKTNTELQNRISTLESRLENFRTKLKTTKETLKETQTELQKARNAKNTSTTAASNFRKRTASEVQADTMIGTPGDLPAAKRSKVNQTLPGEKSTFSITPFLNRTTSVPPESPGQEKVDGELNREPASPTKIVRASSAGPKEGSKRKSRDKEASIPNTSHPEGAQNRKPVSKPAPRKAITAPKLAQVAEETEALEAAPPPADKPLVASKVSTEENIDNTKVERKKRKLLGGGLGKTLFDEEGEEGFGKKITAGKTLVALGKAAGLGPKSQKSATGFGAISPLKKDRRAAQA